MTRVLVVLIAVVVIVTLQSACLGASQRAPRAIGQPIWVSSPFAKYCTPCHVIGSSERGPDLFALRWKNTVGTRVDTLQDARGDARRAAAMWMYIDEVLATGRVTTGYGVSRHPFPHVLLYEERTPMERAITCHHYPQFSWCGGRQ